MFGYSLFVVYGKISDMSDCFRDIYCEWLTGKGNVYKSRCLTGVFWGCAWCVIASAIGCRCNRSAFTV